MLFWIFKKSILFFKLVIVYCILNEILRKIEIIKNFELSSDIRRIPDFSCCEINE